MVNSEKRIPLGLILFLTPLFRFKQQSIHDENEERTYVVLIIAKVCFVLFVVSVNIKYLAKLRNTT